MLAIPKNVQGTGINEQDELPAIILEKQSKPDLFLDGTDVRRVLGGVGAVMARQPEGHQGWGIQGSKLLNDWHRRISVFNKGYVHVGLCWLKVSPLSIMLLGYQNPDFVS